MNRPTRKTMIIIVVVIAVIVLIAALLLRPMLAQYSDAQLTGPDPVIAEIKTSIIPTVNLAEPIGWNDSEAPVATGPLRVNRFATGLAHPRTMLTLANGDVLVAETSGPADNDDDGIFGWIRGWIMDRVGAGTPSADRIRLLRDADGDGVAELSTVLLDGLKSPFGMAMRDERLLVANTDAVLSFPYTMGDLQISGSPHKLLDLPGAGNHWARNILLSKDEKRLFITVGSASNIGENGMAEESGRAAIHEYNFVTGASRQFAGGLRNPNGLALEPSSGELWTSVNERDMLGPDVPLDYLTNVPIGAQYGWPWVYWKEYVDERVEAPMPQFLTEYTRRPEYALGAHTAPLGLLFAEGGNLGPQFSRGAFIARHGSWNRKPPSGYDVVFVPFDERGNPVGETPVTVLGGFLTKDRDKARGRPTWLAWDKNGALLVSDDTAGIIWRVSTGPELSR
ncbi:sorbosone dehydrogenase family protein [Croceicoccus sp. F390]|uniref:Sorbosone dehydrogenase family protein n=1 Tax=Croceicoccus esteveae TaxID=3075597 RepID=A0ABU2ZJ46_9SPHN|nr:sorbosone dehydrogenase family protein [Croceicoccus sp. F390]MDT0576231.1 sorbosone dehydrogenase family protein [Croceicoccus sp. F390]